MSLLFVLALFIFFLHVLTLADIGSGLLRMTRLSNVTSNLPSSTPRVSVIVPACNEADTIEPALQALLDQDYPYLEIVVVNDRSTDDTARVLEELKQKSSKPFTLLTIDTLPGGWLGKSHALQNGADIATGDILLFTDADIEMEKTVISRAVTVFTTKKLDHLCLIFQTIGGSWLLNGMILDAASGLLTVFKPWKAAESNSRYFIGVGAFNMVRASVYKGVGGHHNISMHPIDDIMLGKVIKENGYKQECLLGQPLVRVCWYPHVSAMVEGLMKNVFSVVHYRVWLALLAMMTVFILTVFPVVGVLLSSSTTQVLWGGIILIRLVGLSFGAALSQMGPGAVLGGLLAPLMSIYILARSTCTTLMNKGMYWRGTFYPLKDLRKSRPVLF